MDDRRIWQFEESLWVGDADHYRELIDQECLMVLPAPPYVLTRSKAVEAVADTPRWAKVAFSEQQVARPEEGLIVIAYKAEAKRGDKEAYIAHCSTVMRRIEHDVWKVIQHQQTPPLKLPAKTET